MTTDRVTRKYRIDGERGGGRYFVQEAWSDLYHLTGRKHDATIRPGTLTVELTFKPDEGDLRAFYEGGGEGEIFAERKDS